MENIDDFTTCKSINVNSGKEKEDQIFVSLKIIKNIIIKLNIICKLLIINCYI